MAESCGNILCEPNNDELRRMAQQDTLAIHISFNGDTKYAADTEHIASQSLGVRVLSSYFGFHWTKLNQLRGNFISGLTLDNCLEAVLSHHRRNLSADAPRTILYLAVDDIGGIYPQPGFVERKDVVHDKATRKATAFVKAMTNEIGTILITPPKNSFCVALITGTTYTPVTNILRASSHPYVNLGVPLLPRGVSGSSLDSSRFCSSRGG